MTLGYDSGYLYNDRSFFKITLRQAITECEGIANTFGILEEDVVAKEMLPEVQNTSASPARKPSKSPRTDKYTGSKIIRRCGQLSIPYEDVIDSPYTKERGWTNGKFKIQYKDAAEDGTIGWGDGKRPIPENYTTPHSFDEMLRFLGLSTEVEDAI